MDGGFFWREERGERTAGPQRRKPITICPGMLGCYAERAESWGRWRAKMLSRNQLVE